MTWRINSMAALCIHLHACHVKGAATAHAQLKFPTWAGPLDALALLGAVTPCRGPVPLLLLVAAAAAAELL